MVVRAAAFLTRLNPNPAGVERLGASAFDQHAGGVSEDNGGMRLASERALLRKIRLRLLAFGAILVLIGGAARAQNLDQGKSPAKLFADGCAACHRSPRGLAKGRFRLTLFLYLQDHYASNSSSAWALTSYLESLDGAPRGRSRNAAKPSAAANSSSRSTTRPPASVPGR
jgi:hypothetical protein